MVYGDNMKYGDNMEIVLQRRNYDETRKKLVEDVCTYHRLLYYNVVVSQVSHYSSLCRGLSLLYQSYLW